MVCMQCGVCIVCDRCEGYMQCIKYKVCSEIYGVWGMICVRCVQCDVEGMQCGACEMHVVQYV